MDKFSENLRILRFLTSKIVKGERENSRITFEEKCLRFFRKYATSDDPRIIDTQGMKDLIGDFNALEKSKYINQLMNAWKEIVREKGFLILDEDWIQGLRQLKEIINIKLQEFLDELINMNDLDDMASLFVFDATQILKKPSKNGNDIKFLQILFRECSILKDLHKDATFKNTFNGVCDPRLGNIFPDGAINPNVLEKFAKIVNFSLAKKKM
ncbi:uncharacterized protein LOC111627096 [Centruroides sculpturatus]|uniref:uncharacterized protein LOC111627096 n=1 Tax=Centruroides sculpturatus TaxID=218467 RepID=UPI000C6CF69A|nr:uncharacterized protein LOC111627096 [Centruroides sculpturatus]